jgi:large subunit ribosomal protein L23
MKQILIRPVITEKSLDRVKNNQYTFEVVPGVNKYEIEKAVKDEYKIDVMQVRTVSRKGKLKQVGKKRQDKQMPRRKFAIVKIKTGQKIDAFNQ